MNNYIKVEFSIILSIIKRLIRFSGVPFLVPLNENIVGSYNEIMQILQR
jgi:hypothetical protein